MSFMPDFSKFGSASNPRPQPKPFQTQDKPQFVPGFTQNSGFQFQSTPPMPFGFANQSQPGFNKTQQEPKRFKPQFSNQGKPFNQFPAQPKQFEHSSFNKFPAQAKQFNHPPFNQFPAQPKKFDQPSFNQFPPQPKQFEHAKKSEKTPKFEPAREDFQEDWNEIEARLKEKALKTFNLKKRSQTVPAPKSQNIRISPREYEKPANFNEKRSVTPENQKKPLGVAKDSLDQSKKFLESLKNAKTPVEPRKVQVESVKKPKESLGNASKMDKTESSFAVGSKFTMCSVEECKSREESKQLSIFERLPGTYEYKKEWTVKKYLRSSADREEYIRTSSDLSGTLSYLINNILDVDKNGNPNNYDYQEDLDYHSFQDIYPFLFDRMRAIIKDWKMLKVTDSDDYIRDHECIARFLILSCVEGLTCQNFNLNLNLKLTEDVLNCLVRTYEKKRSKGLNCKNQAEFLSYFIITKPDNMIQIITMLRNLPKEVVESKYVQLALCLLGNYHNEDFEEFFNTVYDSPFLLACAAYPLFHKIRALVLEQMEVSSGKDVSLEMFQQLLGFGDENEARVFVDEFDLGLIENPDPTKAIVKISQIPERKSQIFTLVPSHIMEKCPFETRLETISTAEEFEPDEPLEESHPKPSHPPAPLTIHPVPEEIPAIESPKSPEKPPIPEQSPVKPLFTPVPQVPSPPSPRPAQPALPKFLSPVKVPQLPSEKKPEPVKIPKKKILFEFPFEDKTIFSIINDKKQKLIVKENIRKYRTQKKLKEKSEKRQHESLLKLKIFKAWKTFTNKARLEVYLEKRKFREFELFKEQFSCLIISDLVCQERFLLLNSDIGG